MHGNCNEKIKADYSLLAMRLFVIQSLYKDVSCQCIFSEMVNGVNG